VTMNHPEVLDTGAAERYALGQMSESERDLYEDHFFDCLECAEEVRVAGIFFENAKVVLTEDEGAAAASLPTKPNPASFWAGLRASFWPVPLGAAATLTLLFGGPAAYLRFVEVPRLERARAEADSLQAAPWHFLSVSRSEPPVVSIAHGQRMVGLTLSKSESRTFPFYWCEVRDGWGRVVLSNTVAAPPRGGELQILLPTGKLQPGAQVVAVAGLETSSSLPAESDFTRYHFTFERK
jgi:hypothetical protein